MKTNEIRRKSWVLCNGIPRKVKYVRDDGTRDSQVELFGKPNFITTAEMLEPVPLSVEIMQKNGFEVYGDDGTRYCWAGYGEDKQFDIEVSFDEENDIIKTEIDIAGWYLVTEEIRNVHQLQNIFWDFNIDIEIEHV